jgi:8-oxo-dGTP diphosphatase
MSDKKRVGAGFGVMLLKDGKVLLGRRHDDPEKADSLLHGAGTWTMPGGKFEFGESFEDGAKRELMEETGIVLDKVKVVCVSNDMVEDAHFVTVGFFSEYFDGEPRVMEPDEITEWGWFDLDALPSPLFFPTDRILENYRLNKLYVKRD